MIQVRKIKLFAMQFAFFSKAMAVCSFHCKRLRVLKLTDFSEMIKKSFTIRLWGPDFIFRAPHRRAARVPALYGCSQPTSFAHSTKRTMSSDVQVERIRVLSCADTSTLSKFLALAARRVSSRAE